MKFKFFLFFFLLFFVKTQAQAPANSSGAKKQLEPADLVRWNDIKSPKISNNGHWVAYTLKAEEGDGSLHIWNANKGTTRRFERGEGAAFSADNQFIAFKIKPHEDTLKAQRRRKMKKDELAKDSLGILHLGTGALTKIASVKSFAMPEKWDGWLAYQLEPAQKKEEKAAADSTATSATAPVEKAEKKKEKKPKKEGKDTGTKLVLLDMATQKADTIAFVRDYKLAKEGARVLINSSGTGDSLMAEGVYLFDCKARTLKPLVRQKGDYKSLTFNEKGTQLSFFANLDTAKAQVPPFGLLYWEEGMNEAEILADSASQFLPKTWRVSENAAPVFSKDGSKLYFGIAPPPILQDTNLLDDEIVNVEVWASTDGRLHTNQKTLVEQERKRTYDVVWFAAQNRFVPLATEDLPDLNFAPDRAGSVALGFNDQPYLPLISWEGEGRKDVWLVDEATGRRKEITKNLRGSPRLSPAGDYAFWYSDIDTAWFAFSVKTSEIHRLTDNHSVSFADELNDVPDYPSPYGFATWVGDSTGASTSLLVNDRYDIWQLDPAGMAAPKNLTNGRASRTQYRYVRLDPEERFVMAGQRLLLHVFDEKTKAEGYALLMLGVGQPIQLLKEGFAYSSPQKAQDADRLLFTKENFQTFPDLLYADFTFQKPKKVSNANPQQADYRWGSIELYEWTALDGQRLQGLLVKPEGFDPKKQYPMLVNFYERSSDELNQHRAPYPGRSSISYSYYASRGYLIFNPDIPYRTGYPGESCYNAVVSGVTSLIDKGFVDKARIGAQGHSWGGYQVAYLTTKTDIFRCAESGAPVVNMFSAYGGIRWQTGLSRMFQYEHTQSRIGGTIWEYPLRYIENSPLFSLDKVNTPLLIMHNDADGHVPWYQGIEYFTALRRLGKPAWLLNYNDEPHWPVKLQNRKDFQLRMSQFFDHYLMDKPMPQWMVRGVPAVEKGIRLGVD
jgi:dipeptidyl aminopeptidase/acylaminoacyl peptidase